MAYPSNLLQADWKRVLGAGMMCSVLALGTAFAQEAAPAAADAAAQTEGQREAADAAKYLAEGGEDEPHVREAPAPDAHRVYVGDPAHFAAITQQFIINGSDGTVEGMLDGGFLPNPVVTDDGSMIAQASTVFSRISRGERTDYVEVYDPKTLLPTADIELPNAPRFLVGTYPWMTTFMPDNKSLLFYQFSPAPAVGLVDIEGKKFDRMIDVPDCFHMFPSSESTFFMHCRDGSLAKVEMGAEDKVTQTAVFHGEDEYLINHPAYSMKSKKIVWPTYTGKIYQVDLSSGDANFMDPIETLTAEEQAADWRPGGWQQVAYHRTKDRSYLLVDQRDQWRHKTASRFLVVTDLKTGERVNKFELGHEIDSVAVSQDNDALLYGLSTGDRTLYVYDAETGKELRKVDQLGRGPQVLNVHDLEP
ncbi:methylamine dehydrogenase (amicyanin) large subunit [Paracoccus cavernae]|uniref:methylamine dehydrogenase (amicyanin) large subunit n=1 Tax=Paracoccus cavernae TaxID=1571207 RepID=UPI0035F4324B